MLPAVDVAGGSAVRLVQGAAGTETSYGDPLEAALAWQRGGAEWIHLVDLDAAFGRGSNAELLAKVVRSVDVAVELSGGIRDDVTAGGPGHRSSPGEYRHAALENPEWCDRWWRVRRPGGGRAGRTGRTLSAGVGPATAATCWRCWSGSTAGCARYVVTDIRRDGTMTGPNLDLLKLVCEHTDAP